MKRNGFEKGVLRLIRIRDAVLSEPSVAGQNVRSLDTLILRMALVHVLSLLGVVPRRALDALLTNRGNGSSSSCKQLSDLFEESPPDRKTHGPDDEFSQYRRLLASSPLSTYTVTCRDSPSLSDEQLEELADVLQETVPPSANGSIDARILMLGRIYELLRDHGSRREHGIFYTPATIAGIICDLALAAYERTWASDMPGADSSSIARLIGLQVADNSCGTGVFLVTMLDRLTRLMEIAAEHSPSCRESMVSIGINPQSRLSMVQHFLGKCIHGRDMDETALRIAATQLWLYAVHHCDPNPSSLPHIDLVAVDTLVQGKSDATCFDIVVGNPPYMRASLLPEDTKARLRESYPVVREYNAHALFIDSAVEHLNAGGVLGYIIHKNAFALDSFMALRERLVTSYHCTDLIDCGFGVFKGVTAETGIIVLRKVPVNPSLNTRLSHYTVSSGTMDKMLVLPQNDYTRIVRPWNYRYLLSVNQDDIRLLERFQDLPRIDEQAVVRRGIETGDNRRYLTDSPTGDRNWTPVLRGRDIVPFRAEPSMYLDYSRESLAKPGPANMQRLSKVVVQQNARNPIASYDEGRSLVLNSATYISEAPEEFLKSLCVFLNSGLVRWFFRKVMTNNATVTVNVLPNNLGRTPVPASFDRTVLAWLCDLLISGAVESEDSEAKKAEYREWWRTIGEAVVLEAYLPELFPGMRVTRALSSFILNNPSPEQGVLASSGRESLSAIAKNVLGGIDVQPMADKDPVVNARTRTVISDSRRQVDRHDDPRNS